MNFQVVESFGSPEFFDMLFPLLFEACNRTNGTNSGMSTAIKTGKLYDFSFDTKDSFCEILCRNTMPCNNQVCFFSKFDV